MKVGFSTHNLAQALASAEGGADYIGFGPVFWTASKANPDPTVGLAGLAGQFETIPDHVRQFLNLRFLIMVSEENRAAITLEFEDFLRDGDAGGHHRKW